jgi:hypothetical protein
MAAGGEANVYKKNEAHVPEKCVLSIYGAASV